MELIDCDGDVGVVVIVEWDVPICSVKATAVREKLYGIGLSVVWVAESQSKLVCAIDGFGLSETLANMFPHGQCIPAYACLY